MTLKEDLQPPGGRALSLTAFAGHIGCKPSTVKRWVDGTAFPSAECLGLILDATGGQVTPNDMFAGLNRKPSRAKA